MNPAPPVTRSLIARSAYLAPLCPPGVRPSGGGRRLLVIVTIEASARLTSPRAAHGSSRPRRHSLPVGGSPEVDHVTGRHHSPAVPGVDHQQPVVGELDRRP